MSGFKLLAIRPLKECHSDLLKVLNEGDIYQLYNEYEFIRKNELDIHSEIKSVKIHKSVPHNLFSTENLDINISAIVGKNGSGKSSLIELFFVLVYLISVENKKIEKPEDTIGLKKFEELKLKLKVEIYYSEGSTVRCLKYDSNIKNPLGTHFTTLYTENELEKRNKTIELILDGEESFELSKFFYSIAVNYSIYGLNAKSIGNWINELFHKNDAYQTPLVINPMRTDGNFDINDEEDLLKSRLLSNVLSLGKDNKLLYSEIAPYKKVKNLRFKLNLEKVSTIKEEHPPNMNPIIWRFETLYKAYGDGIQEDGESKIIDLIYTKLVGIPRGKCAVEFKELAERYIVKKLHKIARTYPDFFKFLEGSFGSESLVYAVDGEHPFPYFLNKGENSFSKYLDEIKKEKSHITFKLNQAVNYLKNDILKADFKHQWKPNDSFEISPYNLAQRINELNKDNSEIINLIPPSLFNIEIEVNDKKQTPPFLVSSMSSGEQQLIHSVQSVIYHIRNINSVFGKNPNIKDEFSNERLTYTSINLIMDEIELYYHPDYQKKYISYLLTAIRQIKIDPLRDNQIKNLNILFSTHSPFILSDIPSQNILKLKRNKEGKSVSINDETQTFGANIHDLLANEFFMESGFMGEFAKEKIKSVINFLSNKSKQSKDWNIDSAKEFIELIGEPYLKGDLLDLYKVKKGNLMTDEEIEKEIQRLTKLKNK